jgi:hypothetical protein
LSLEKNKKSMLKRIKFLIGILVVVALGGAGWLVWQWQDYLVGGVKVTIQTDKEKYPPGESLIVTINNNFRKNICFSSCYPYYLEKKDGEWISYPYGKCKKFDITEICMKPNQVKAFEIQLNRAKEGLHRIAVPACIGCHIVDFFREDKRFYSNEFLIK